MTNASYFDGVTTFRHVVTVKIAGNSLNIHGETVSLTVPIDAVTVSEKIGGSTSSLLLNNGARIELKGDALDIVGAIDQPNRVWSLVYLVESHWRLVAVCLLGVIGLTYAFIRFGMPIVAQAIAFSLPPSVDSAIGEQGLKLLDKGFFQPTALDLEQQMALKAQFEEVANNSADTHTFRLEFRQGGPLGANALALPSGIIVITDELIELAECNDEITAVFAHEVGHVVHRHSLRLLLQDTGTALILGILLGDIASTSSMAAAIPTVLVQSSYSRQFESEADSYAYNYLTQHGKDSALLSDFLFRLEKRAGGEPDSWSYLSTHPPASDRVPD